MHVFRRAADSLQPVAQDVIEESDFEYDTDDDEGGSQPADQHPSDAAIIAGKSTFFYLAAVVCSLTLRFSSMQLCQAVADMRDGEPRAKQADACNRD